MNNKGQTQKTIEVAVIIAAVILSLVSIMSFSQTTGNVVKRITNIGIPQEVENQTSTTTQQIPSGSTGEPTIQGVPTTPQPPAGYPPIKTQAACVVPYDNMLITSDTTFCRGTYYLNDSDGNGAIQIGANNVVLDCNDSTFIGDSNGKTISWAGYHYYNNVIIDNCNITNYGKGIEVYGNNVTIKSNYLGDAVGQLIFIIGNNSLLEYNTFYGNQRTADTYISIGDNGVFRGNVGLSTNNTAFIFMLTLTDKTKNWAIYNNNITNRNGFVIYGNNNLIYSNNVKNIKNDMYGAVYLYGHNNSYIGNIHRDGKNTITTDEGSNGIFIENNYLYNNSDTISSLVINKGSKSVNINNNTIILSDIGIYITNASFINITNNIIKDTYMTIDWWRVGLYADRNSANIFIKNNTFINYSSGGILIRQTSNVSIIGNQFYQMSIEDKLALNIHDGSEPTFAIGALEIYKSWSSGDEQTSDNITKIHELSSNNIDISGNFFSNTTQTFLRIQGASGVISDLTYYWYTHFQSPVYLVDKDEFYNSNNYDKLYFSDTTNVSYNFLQGYNGISSSAFKIKYSVSKSNMTFKNINDSENYAISLFNLSLAFPYNDIKNVSNNVILATNVDQFNITLSPNQQIIVGNFVNKSFPVNLTIALINTSCQVSANQLTNITIETYNDILQSNTTYNNVISASTNINASVNDSIYCRSYSGNVSVTSNVVIVPNTPPIIDMILTNSNCSIFITSDNQYIINLSINNVSTNTSFVEYNASSGESLNCTAIVTDPFNTSKYSQTLIAFIPVIIYNETLTNSKVILNISITNAANSSIEWFKNSKSLSYKEFNNSIVSELNLTSDNYYAIISADSTTVTTNNYTIAVPGVPNTPVSHPGTGSGGGGGIGTPPPKKDPVGASLAPLIPGTRDDTIKNVAHPEATIEQTTQNSIVEKHTETPKTSTTTNNTSIYIYIIGSALLSIVGIVYIIKRPKVDNPPGMDEFILSSLRQGYTYEAIKDSLEKSYSIDTINHRVKKVREQGFQPIIRYDTPQVRRMTADEKAALWTQLKEYADNQRSRGFKDKDIREALIHYGHDKGVVDSVFS